MNLLKNKSDQELIEAYIAGNEEGLRFLIERYKTKIYTAIYVRVKDEFLAEDIFQQTFIKVINTLKLGRYNDEGKLLPLFIRIAFNMVINRFVLQETSQTVVDSR